MQLGPIPSAGSARAGVIDDWDAVRGDLEASLNFWLPDEWLHGTVDLVATLDVDVAACGVDAGKPQIEKTIEFSPRKKLKIGYIPISIYTSTEDYPVKIGDIAKLHKTIEALFPLADTEVKIYSEEHRRISSLPLYLKNGGWQLLLTAVNVKKFELEAGEYDADLYLTVNSVDTEVFSYCTVSSDASVLQCSLVEDQRYCHFVVGRNLGLPILFEDGEPEEFSWPYDDHTIHDFGMDMRTGSVIHPGVYDVMSHKETIVQKLPYWISPFHYKKAFNNVGPPVDTASTMQAAAEALMVMGIASADEGYLYPVDQVSGTPVTPTPKNSGGEYCVRSMAGGSALETTCFNLELNNPAESLATGSAAFVVYLSPNAAITSIQLLKSGALLKQLDVPTTQPVASMKSTGYDATYKSVVAALNIDESVKASYHYNFLYSSNNGTTWTPVGTDVHPDQLKYIDGAFQWGFSAHMVQPGSQCRIRALVSDGFHTTELTSDPFAVPDLGPEVGIDTPDQNDVINAFPLTFSGYAWDVDDGDRSDGIVWSSDVDGNLGSGETIDVDKPVRRRAYRDGNGQRRSRSRQHRYGPYHRGRLIRTGGRLSARPY